MNKKILSLGSNLGDRKKNIHLTIKKLEEICEVQKISPLYETTALLPPQAEASWNRPFLNLVLQIENQEKPLQFLEKLQSIEKDLGRHREAPWSPRPIDIDLLFWGEEKCNTPRLTLPHPEWQKRSFVLDPLKDIDHQFTEIARKAPRHRPLWMAIVNLTPDSFSNKGDALSSSQFSELIQYYNEIGVHIVDIGAESTRPGAQPISEREEWLRLLPNLEQWRETFVYRTLRPKLSLDTYKIGTLQKALPFGVDIINDVTGLADPEMLQLLKDCSCEYILTHSLGVPADSGTWNVEDPMASLKNWLQEKLEVFYKNNISFDRIYFDPGIGFGKSPSQSTTILKNIENFHSCPTRLLIGHSRKSFMSTMTALAFEHRDIETLGVSLELIKKGVDVLRVHNPDIHIRAQKAMDHVTS